MSDLGNKKIFSENLKYYMQLNEKDRNDICRDLGFAYTTFAEWYNGNIYPRIDKIEILANYFNIKKSDLIEDKEKTKLDQLGNPVISIDLLGSVKAGYNGIVDEHKIGTVTIPVEMSKTGDFFALQVKGDSMFPALFEDDIVIIKKQNDFETGDLVVAIINGDEATVKKGKKTEFGIMLQPLNTNYEPLIYTYDQIKTVPVTIIGVVKELKRTY